MKSMKAAEEYILELSSETRKGAISSEEVIKQVSCLVMTVATMTTNPAGFVKDLNNDLESMLESMESDEFWTAYDSFCAMESE